VYHLNEMVKGWFIGLFNPAVFSTAEVEVAVKSYKAGEYEPVHHHKIATEITVIAVGSVRMMGKEYKTGSIIVQEPNDATDFLALTDVVTSVVKIPGVPNDKYLGEPE